VTRALCGSGQQHPFRAPQRVQRIAFEIVSSGVSMSSRCCRASSCGSIMTLCRQPGALAELNQHGKVGLLPGVVFGDVVPAHAAHPPVSGIMVSRIYCVVALRRETKRSRQ
jgi:hypothetical protein